MLLSILRHAVLIAMCFHICHIILSVIRSYEIYLCTLLKETYEYLFFCVCVCVCVCACASEETAEENTST
jgi:hypothetical protein